MRFDDICPNSWNTQIKPSHRVLLIEFAQKTEKLTSCDNVYNRDNR